MPKTMLKLARALSWAKGFRRGGSWLRGVALEMPLEKLAGKPNSQEHPTPIKHEFDSSKPQASFRDTAPSGTGSSLGPQVDPHLQEVAWRMPPVITELCVESEQRLEVSGET